MVTPQETLYFLKNKELRVQKLHHALWQKACRDAEAIIAMIKENYSPQRIYQWGSLLKPERFRAYSDIDIAVEGVRNAAIFFELYGRAMRMTDFSLDLLAMEDIEPAFASLIRRHGQCVYER